LCSPLVLLALRNHFVALLLAFLAASCACVALSFPFVRFPDASAAAPPGKSPEAAANPETSLLLTVALSFLFFTYVGVETSLGGWASAHTKRLAHAAADISTIAPMFFYLGVTAGRAAGPFLLARLREGTLVLSNLALVFLGSCIAILSPTQHLAVV